MGLLNKIKGVFKSTSEPNKAPDVTTSKDLPIVTEWKTVSWDSRDVVVSHMIQNQTNVASATALNEKEAQMNVLDLMKAVFAIVKMIELALPDSAGKTKFDAAMTTLNEQAGDVVKDKIPLVTTLINAAVNILNLLGIFKKKPAVESPAG